MMQPLLTLGSSAPPMAHSFGPAPADDPPLTGPLSYQVYSSDSPPATRSSLSPGAFSDMSSAGARPHRRTSVGALVCLVLVGVCVVVGTAILVVMGTADEPRAKPTASPNARAVAPAPVPKPTPVVVTAPAPQAIEPPPAAAPAVVAAPTAGKSAKPKPVASAPVREVAVPPNPFGGDAPVKPTPKKK
jgi:hypothetical protein